MILSLRRKLELRHIIKHEALRRAYGVADKPLSKEDALDIVKRIGREYDLK